MATKSQYFQPLQYRPLDSFTEPSPAASTRTKMSTLTASDSVELRRAAHNHAHDRYTTSIVEGRRDNTYILGTGDEHIDIIPAVGCQRPEGRLVIRHPLIEKDLQGFDSTTSREISRHLSQMQWVSYKHHTWLPEMATRSSAIRLLNKVAAVKPQDKVPCKRILLRNGDVRAINAPKETAPLPARFEKIALPDWPQSLSLNRLWRVLNGPRAGIWLCEECDKCHEECFCPRGEHPDEVITQFGAWENPQDEDEYWESVEKNYNGEGSMFFYWRYCRSGDMLIDRGQFGQGQPAWDKTKYNTYDDDHDFYLERDLNEL